MPTNKKHGFTLLELIIALGIAAVIITTTLGMVGSIYFSQKKLLITQDFFAESRFLMERMTQMIRNNTIDYDRYFIEVGPDNTACPVFDPDQTPTQEAINNNSAETRASLGYPNIFYWDTTASEAEGYDVQDKNLGGKRLDDGENDLCVKAWNDDPVITLYLINRSRTTRIAVRRNNDEDQELEVQRQLSADLDNDGVGDVWAPLDVDGNGNFDEEDLEVVWNHEDSNLCQIRDYSDNTYDILGEKTSEDFCSLAHNWTVISPEQIKIESLTFVPSPDQDPYLSFAVNEAQIHPHVFILLKAKLRDPESFGIEEDETPTVSLQTTASSRTFGDIRK
ncbi:type II secretion system GspH family protein [Candidatus Gracilibacteria bacterium]|nr:type II secretion system GspH family protein [Candidatus Gracilibacteria bacterium]